MGLALRRLSSFEGDVLLTNAYNQKQIKRRQFSFLLNREGRSEFTLGGFRRDSYRGELETHKIADTGYWQIDNGSITVKGTPVVTGVKAIFDTTTPFIFGPPADVKKIYDSIPGSAVSDAEKGYYSVPCDAEPSVGLNFGGKDWVMAIEEYVRLALQGHRG